MNTYPKAHSVIVAFHLRRPVQRWGRSDHVCTAEHVSSYRLEYRCPSNQQPPATSKQSVFTYVRSGANITLYCWINSRMHWLIPGNVSVFF